MDSHTIINLFHIFLAVPFLLQVGFTRNEGSLYLQWSVLALGIFITVQHAQKAFVRYSANSSFIWVNLIHALYLGPLLIQIGAQQKETPRSAYEILLLFAFAALGYHIQELAAQTNFNVK